MKRIGHLWESLISLPNLSVAFRKARQGKRKKAAVRRFDFAQELELLKLHEELSLGTYHPGPYRTFHIHDRKLRLISASPFRDRVVHHAFCNIVEPHFERTFIAHSFASRRGKGTHVAVRLFQKFARKFPYVLKCDIRQFFPSIDHLILKEDLARKIKDQRVLGLAAVIIDASNPQVAVRGIFPGDDLLTRLERRRGLPLGNQTSQFFGNVYLNPLDHFIKEDLQCQGYLRYCDDFVVFGETSSKLIGIRDQIESFLLTRRLWLHPRKRAISRTQDGLPFLGYRIWPEKIWVAEHGLRRFRKRLRCYRKWVRTGRLRMSELTQRIRACLGHLRQANAERWCARTLENITFVGSEAESPFRTGWCLQQHAEQRACGQAQQEPTEQP